MIEFFDKFRKGLRRVEQPKSTDAENSVPARVESFDLSNTPTRAEQFGKATENILNGEFGKWTNDALRYIEEHGFIICTTKLLSKTGEIGDIGPVIESSAQGLFTDDTAAQRDIITRVATLFSKRICPADYMSQVNELLNHINKDTSNFCLAIVPKELAKTQIIKHQNNNVHLPNPAKPNVLEEVINNANLLLDRYADDKGIAVFTHIFYSKTQVRTPSPSRVLMTYVLPASVGLDLQHNLQVGEGWMIECLSEGFRNLAKNQLMANKPADKPVVFAGKSDFEYSQLRVFEPSVTERLGELRVLNYD